MKLLLWITILLLLLGGVYFGFIAVNKPDRFGFKGVSFYYFGRRIWKFTNRVFGLLLLIGSLVFAIIIKSKQLMTAGESTKKIFLIVIFVVLSFATTDILAFLVMNQQKKKKKNIKQS